MTPNSINIQLPTERLTPREIDVLTLTAQGERRSEISEALSISEETVKGYVEQACRKLNARNKTHASILAIFFGLIEPYRPCGLVKNPALHNKKTKKPPRTGDAFVRKSSVLPPPDPRLEKKRKSPN